jgi:hypothetical protein
MVLENATVESDTGVFQDAPPPSDSDTYDSSSESGRSKTYHIEGSNLPKPCPGMGFVGYNDATLAKLVHLRMSRAAQLLKREPNQEEATALAFWTAKQFSIMSYSTPLGAAGGLYAAWSKADTFRFPFFQPDRTKFNPNVFPSARIALSSGPRAVAMWHALRAVSYGVVGNFISKVVVTSYAASVVAVGEMQDKRLSALIKATQELAAKMQGRLPDARRGQPSPVPSPAGRQGAAIDDASPTSTTEWPSNNGDSVEKDVPQASEVMSQSARPLSVQRGRQPAAAAAPDPYDEASPTGGSLITDDTSSTGSAWDRIRQQASQSPRSGNGLAPADDADPYAKYERVSRPDTESFQEGSLSSRAAAQREFDERLDRERRGGNF